MSKKKYTLRNSVVEPSLTKFKSGETIDVYHQRTESLIKIDRKNRKPFRWVNLPITREEKKSGMVKKTTNESNQIFTAIQKFLIKSYPKDDYIGRYIRVNSKESFLEIVIQTVDSKIFLRKFKEVIKKICGRKYKFSFKETSGDEIYDKRFYNL